ncbi:hypothetical protein, partial [Staphylococcus aureus]
EVFNVFLSQDPIGHLSPLLKKLLLKSL